MIVVTGATGNVGGELVNALVARGTPVRALTRDPSGGAFPDVIDVMAGDLDVPDSLTPALDGARKVFLLGGFAAMSELLRRFEKWNTSRACSG